jgi:hypothetical protein
MVDLRSNGRGGSWHPLTSLIQITGPRRPFYGLPYVVEPPRIEGRIAVSTIHHELAHLGCAKTTRLGWALGFEAGRLLKDYRRGDPLSIREPISILLGAFLPILEGLAMYAELDWQEYPESIILPHPIVVHSQAAATALHARVSKMLPAVRMEQIIEMPPLAPDLSALLGPRPEYGPGLLRLLFADTRSPANTFYLLGYLWTKALAATLKTLNPLFGLPTIFLPFMTRWLCHHRAIEHVMQGTMDAQKLLATLQDSVFSLSQVSLSAFEKAMHEPELRARFDLWRVHDFAESGDIKYLFDDKNEDIRPFIDADQADEEIMQCRAAANIYFPSTTEGILTRMETTAQGCILHIRDPQTGEDLPPAPIMPVKAYFDMFSLIPRYRALIPSALPKALMLEQVVHNAWKASEGHEITLATYMDFSTPMISGVASWLPQCASASPAAIAYEPAWYEYAEHIERSTDAFRFSPAERREFALALPRPAMMDWSERVSTKFILEQLVGEPVLQSRMLNMRFKAVLDQPERDDVERWVSPTPIEFRRPWDLHPDTIAALNLKLSLPGFAHCGLLAADLLPTV